MNQPQLKSNNYNNFNGRDDKFLDNNGDKSDEDSLS